MVSFLLCSGAQLPRLELLPLFFFTFCTVIAVVDFCIVVVIRDEGDVSVFALLGTGLPATHTHTHTSLKHQVPLHTLLLPLTSGECVWWIP